MNNEMTIDEVIMELQEAVHLQCYALNEDVVKGALVHLLQIRGEEK